MLRTKYTHVTESNKRWEQLPSSVAVAELSLLPPANNHPPFVVVVGAAVVPLDATSHSNMHIIQPVNKGWQSMKLWTIPQAMQLIMRYGMFQRIPTMHHLWECQQKLRWETRMRSTCPIGKGGTTNDGAAKVGLFGLSRNSPESNIYGGLEPTCSCLQHQ